MGSPSPICSLENLPEPARPAEAGSSRSVFIWLQDSERSPSPSSARRKLISLHGLWRHRNPSSNPSFATFSLWRQPLPPSELSLLICKMGMITTPQVVAKVPLGAPCRPRSSGFYYSWKHCSPWGYVVLAGMSGMKTKCSFSSVQGNLLFSTPEYTVFNSTRSQHRRTPCRGVNLSLYLAALETTRRSPQDSRPGGLLAASL